MPSARSMDRLAESIIDEVLRGAVRERQEVLDRALAAFASARRELAVAERDLRAWRNHREFGHESAIKALTAAQLADFVPSAIPPGTHQQAVAAYFKAYPPVWRSPDRLGAAGAIRRAVGEFIKTTGSAAGRTK